MAKTQKRWIRGTFRDSTNNQFTDLISYPDESLSALCIPYDYTTSVFEAINAARSGITGLKGVQGATGLAAAPQGYTGLQGVQGHTGIGKQGLTGMGVPGATGILGNTGIMGVTGLVGPHGGTGIEGVQGLTGYHGITGFRGITGVAGNPGLGATGIRGITGAQGVIGGTGIQGFTGMPALPIQKLMFSPVSRYAAVSEPGREVWVVSSSSVFMGLDWTRSGTVLNIYRDAHGHIAGNRVILRNTNLDYQATLIDSTTMNSFRVTTVNTGNTVGNGAGYSLGFTYAHDSDPSTMGVVTAPSGDHADCQLLSMKIRTGSRVGTEYNLVVPASAINGAGQNTDLGDCFVPDFNIRSDSDYLVGVGATMTTNISGSYSTFQFAALGSSLSRIIIVHF